MRTLLSVSRSRSLADVHRGIALPSLGAGRDSGLIDDRLTSMRKLLSSPVSNITSVRESDTVGLDLPAQLAVKNASFKRMTSAVAMHLDTDWRKTLFTSLDRMLDPDDWDQEFALPREQSFSTFLRMIIYLHPTKRPGLGLSPRGHFLAAWSREGDRIVMECLGSDEVRWVISRTRDGERESGAGKVLLHRVPDVTAPYDPEPLFNNGEKLLA